MRTIALATVLLAASYLACGRASDISAAVDRYAQLPILNEDENLAVSCLVWGQMTPSFEEVPDAQLDVYIEVIARLLASYGRADFDAFLALRAGDIEAAELTQASQASSLRDFALQLGVDSEDIPDSWCGTLRTFWNAYYAAPPVSRWIPEATEIRYRSSLPSTLAEWEASFDERCAELSGALIEHHLVVPPRESIDDLLASRCSLQWFDIVLGYETQQLEQGQLLARFVRTESAAEEWTLCRAVTALDTETPQPSHYRQLIL